MQIKLHLLENCSLRSFVLFLRKWLISIFLIPIQIWNFFIKLYCFTSYKKCCTCPEFLISLQLWVGFGININTKSKSFCWILELLADVLENVPCSLWNLFALNWLSLSFPQVGNKFLGRTVPIAIKEICFKGLIFWMEVHSTDLAICSWSLMVAAGKWPLKDVAHKILVIKVIIYNKKNLISTVEKNKFYHV